MTKSAAIPLMNRFGLARHRPVGTWTVATGPEPIVGTGYRRDAVQDYCDAVRRAERYGLRYGVRLRREPHSPDDEEIITVIGTVDSRGPMGRRRQQEWTIGVLSRGLTRQVTDRFLDRGREIAAELISIIDTADSAPLVSLSILVPAETTEHTMRPCLSVVQ